MTASDWRFENQVFRISCKARQRVGSAKIWRIDGLKMVVRLNESGAIIGRTQAIMSLSELFGVDPSTLSGMVPVS